MQGRGTDGTRSVANVRHDTGADLCHSLYRLSGPGSHDHVSGMCGRVLFSGLSTKTQGEA